MSICPRPDSIEKTEYGTPATLTVNPPAQRTEACNATITSVTTGSGTSTSTIIYVQGPAGPPGPAGPAGCALGMKWRGDWQDATEYKKQTCPDNPNADVVNIGARSFICVEDHTSDSENKPVDFDGGFYWELVSGNDGSSSSLLPEEKSFFDKLKDGVFDWIKNADMWDWLLLGAGALGVLWAGSKILDMYNDDGEGDGDADQRYNGSPGYAGAHTKPKLKDVVEQLCLYANIPYDVDDLPDEDCEFTIGNNTSVRTILEQLSLAYQFDMVSSAGYLRFVPRNVTSVATLTLDDMGFSTSEDVPPPYTSKRFQGIDLPRSVSLSYYAEDVDYNTFTQISTIHTYTDGNDIQITVPATLAHTKAREIAEVSLINAHLERMNYKFNTTYKFIQLEPGDVITSPMGLVRILKVNEIDEGILEFEACDGGSAEALAGSDLPVQLPDTSNNIPSEIGYSQTLWLDPNNLNDQDKSVRIYAAVHGYGKAGWPGAALYMSKDNGATYKMIASTSQEATLGLVEAAISPKDWHIWDNTTTITVKLKTGSLISKSEIAVLNGENWAMVGQEIIGFKTATLISAGVYELTGLLRGRQGTEGYVSTHQVNEVFCLIDSSLVKIELADSDRGTIRKFKTVTFGSSLDVSDEETVQIISNNTRAWAPWDGDGVMSGQNWNITWKETVRFDNQLKDYATANHDFDWAGWGVAILGPGDVVKSTHITQLPEFTYTAQMQMDDFGVLQNNLKVSVVQLSQKWGGGYPLVINK